MPVSQTVFEKYSVDGQMTCRQLKSMLEEQGYTEVIRDEEIDAAFIRLDKDESGLLSYPEFLEWWRAEYEPKYPEPAPGEWEEPVSYQRSMGLMFLSRMESTKTKEAKSDFMRATDNATVMTKETFHRHCYRNGYCLTLDEVDQAFQELDKDGSGEVDFSEYLRWWRTDDRFKHLPQDESQEMREWVVQVSDYFRQYDTDFSGYLDTEQFTKMFNESLSDWGLSLEDVLDQADVNRDGKISLNEFISWYAGSQEG
mmetsp:Transcript_19722/g.35094  ORF Transcript_19722/g.35094 Transcript_19722/m.35094 type:complete len:255 (-) Transcript_19722:8-772(-)